MFYENNWTSLNTRPVPKWFADAKFGIFIHWGLYSVPGFARKGEYAEWYGKFLEDAIRSGNTAHPIVGFHERTYGKGFAYADFVKDFRAELFDAKEWIALFERAGARYMNFVSKHHDGFCMYKSSYAPFWNSVEVGPHRDFCAELRDAAEGSAVRFGVYHSIYEWWHPDYLRDPEAYALTHLHPMMKELIERYQPHTLFTDGEWEHPSSVWHSTEFLQWLYNESSVRNFIVPNDRWGSETRGALGGNFTTEYGEVGLGRELSQTDPRPFEECRGIGRSFGINRIESVDDYMSAKELLGLLISLVSAGGNLLLNVGPAADGTIPVIMQERLMQMGAWLQINGKAIYGSRPYSIHKDEHFYYTTGNGAIYAITDRYPAGEVIFNSIPYQPGMGVRLLGLADDPSWEVCSAEGKAAIRLPVLLPHQLAGQHYYVYEIGGKQVL